MPEPCRVLLIDDEQGFHELFRYLLEPLGIELHSAYNGMAGLECLEKQDYAVVFLDSHMPKMPGMEVLRKIRATNLKQPVVLVSSNFDPARALEREAGALRVEAYLEKPFDADQVTAIVKKITGRSAQP